VKELINIKFRFFVFTAIIMALISSCNETNDLGMELLPSTDLIHVKNLIEKNSFSSYTFTEGPIRTDEPSKSLIGSMNDPVFGNTTINLAVQFRLTEPPDYGTNTVIDSVRLYLYYRLMYGDTVTPQTFRVYEIESPLDVDQTYRQDVDLSAMAYNFPIGERIYKPVVKVDSLRKDTLYQLITIPIDNSLGEKLANADPSVLVNNDLFLQYFKGLLIESEKQTGTGGSILTLEAAYSTFFQGSALAVYYENDENRNKTVPDTLMYHAYQISPFSARVNSITHDYSGTPFEANLNTESGNDSLIYIQPTGGLRSKIFIDGLTSWRDSANTAINRAELVFQIDTIASDVKKFPPPSQLLFVYINEDGKEILPADYFFSTAYYGGRLRSDYTYRFNITQHMQKIINGEIQNRGFFLTTGEKNDEAKRVIIKGSNSQTGINLIVTYSKFLQ
jgi:hypothetical protein